jgi:hypothetical protein
VIWIVKVPVADPPQLSVTLNVKVKEPEAVGMPAIP